MPGSGWRMVSPPSRCAREAEGRLSEVGRGADGSWGDGAAARGWGSAVRVVRVDAAGLPVLPGPPALREPHSGAVGRRKAWPQRVRPDSAHEALASGAHTYMPRARSSSRGATWPCRRGEGGRSSSLPGRRRRDRESLGASATGEEGLVWLCTPPPRQPHSASGTPSLHTPVRSAPPHTCAPHTCLTAPHTCLTAAHT